MDVFSEALKWATRAAGAPGVAGLLGQGTQVAKTAAPVAKAFAPLGVGLNLMGAGVGGVNPPPGV
jgi:hypothetical protein